MVDKIKPLKLESSATGGTENDFGPSEADPTEDYVATKGIAFEGLDAFRIEKLGRAIVPFQPDGSVAVAYTAGGDVSSVEIFNSATQIVANRIARVDLSYSGVDPTSETWVIYDSNGTTVLRTIAISYTYTGVDITSAAQVTS